ncbi:hypothetical protein KKA53_04895, partial [Candidatus Dependentiae bacterium]|nr:hypothetical protein [Candidatus Dependentiae bacterium]
EPEEPELEAQEEGLVERVDLVLEALVALWGPVLPKPIEGDVIKVGEQWYDVVWVRPGQWSSGQSPMTNRIVLQHNSEYAADRRIA